MAAAVLGSTEGELPGGLPVLTWPVFEGLPLQACVTTRRGGVSRGRYTGLNLGLHVGDDDASVLANRLRLAAGLGRDLDDLVFCNQTHRPHVQVVTAQHRGRGSRSLADAIDETDALVTTVPGIVLVVMVADCVPLVLIDPQAGILACVHAGWRGTVLGVTTATLHRMVQLGADPARVVAGIGPAIHRDRYQVGAEVAGAAREAFGDRVEAVVRSDGPDRWLFDLCSANAMQLRDGGVPAGQIQDSGRSTGPGTPFYSHRFEGPTGRFAVAAQLLPT